jgi:hypothetical protein
MQLVVPLNHLLTYMMALLRSYPANTAYKIGHNFVWSHLVKSWATNNHISIDKLSAAIVDTKQGYTTQSLLRIGLNPCNVIAINYDRNELAPLSCQYGIGTHAGSFSNFISNSTRGYQYILYDVCQTLPNSENDIRNIFAGGLMTSGIFVAVLSSRCKLIGSKRWVDRCDEYVTHVVSDAKMKANRLILKEFPRAQYKNSMYCLMFEIYQ